MELIMLFIVHTYLQLFFLSCFNFGSIRVRKFLSNYTQLPTTQTDLRTETQPETRHEPEPNPKYSNLKEQLNKLKKFKKYL